MAILYVNGKPITLSDDPRTTLLDTLRENPDLTGTKKGCDHGQCGACTLLLNGRRVNSCLVLAIQCEDSSVTTIEGLSLGASAGESLAENQGSPLHPMQRAFVKFDSFQCGYCTPGQICSAVGMLEELGKGEPSDVTGRGEVILSRAEIQERMSGNLCRCGAYANIVDAILATAREYSASNGAPKHETL